MRSGQCRPSVQGVRAKMLNAYPARATTVATMRAIRPVPRRADRPTGAPTTSEPAAMSRSSSVGSTSTFGDTSARFRQPRQSRPTMRSNDAVVYADPAITGRRRRAFGNRRPNLHGGRPAQPPSIPVGGRRTSAADPPTRRAIGLGRLLRGRPCRPRWPVRGRGGRRRRHTDARARCHLTNHQKPDQQVAGDSPPATLVDRVDRQHRPHHPACCPVASHSRVPAPRRSGMVGSAARRSTSSASDRCDTQSWSHRGQRDSGVLQGRQRAIQVTAHPHVSRTRLEA